MREKYIILHFYIFSFTFFFFQRGKKKYNYQWKGIQIKQNGFFNIKTNNNKITFWVLLAKAHLYVSV